MSRAKIEWVPADTLQVATHAYGESSTESVRGVHARSTERVQKYVKNLLGTLATDKVKGRMTTEQHFGRIVMTPKGEGPDRLYRATEAFDLSSVLSNSGCGGRI